ncbi:MAG: hypothetical protein NZ920_03825 [Aigarchaeota archaeon]|nr:hypothetical protein [Aigarchaeota archaeon]MDW8092251.1 hypothetical protein [Nitrososphaerota archaeon]
MRRIVVAAQMYVNRLVGEGRTRRSIQLRLSYLRGFLGYYGVYLPPRAVKVPRKAGRSRIDRIPSLAELQRIVTLRRSPRMRLAIITMCLTGIRFNEALSLRRE